MLLVDELGVPVSGVPFAMQHSGASDTVTTDGDGQAQIADDAAQTATASFADAAALREALRDRWNAPRDGDALQDSDNVTVVELHGSDLPSVELAPGVTQTISVQPYVERGRLIGGYFDTSKSFLLPSGLDGVRAIISMYGDNQGAALLIVGHTDSTGAADYNDKLSLERANALKDYLTQNVDGWLPWYGSTQPAEKRWGVGEDEAMIGALPDAGTRDDSESPIAWYRRTRGMAPGEKPDKPMRQSLIGEYMALEGTSLPDGISVVTHGCGANFPADAVPDGVADPDDRRVEVFFFDGVLGVQPPPPGGNSGPGSMEYPEWAKRAKRTADFLGGGGNATFRWVSWSVPYGQAPQDLQLELLDDSQNLLVAIAGAEATMSGKAIAFDLTRYSSAISRLSFARLATSAGAALEFAIPISDIVAASAGVLPDAGASSTVALELELVARFADGTTTTACEFLVEPDGAAAVTVGPGVQAVNVNTGGTVLIRARCQSANHWLLDDALLELLVNSSSDVQVLRHHPDFKPPALTNATLPPRIVCEYFLSRLKDFTKEATDTVATGAPDGRMMTLAGDFIPQSLSERPQGLGLPVPKFGQFDIVGTTLQRQPAAYASTSARVVEIKSGSGPKLGNNPRVVGLCWNVGDTSDAAKNFVAGAMDVLMVLSIPHKHDNFLSTGVHQHSFDYMWLYPFWWMNYFVIPTEAREPATPPHTTDYPPAGTEQDPFVFLGGGGRFRAGAGVSHQVASTGRPILSVFPVPGIGGDTSEWLDPGAFSEFLFELFAMLRRQMGDYRPLGRGDHVKRIGVCGHSQACADAVLPMARAWSASSSVLKTHFVDAIFLDPPEGSFKTFTTDLIAWAAHRKGDSTLRVCIATKFPNYIVALGGTSPRGGASRESLTDTPLHPCPIRFVFVSNNAWRSQWESVLGKKVIDDHGMVWERLHADDAHISHCYYGVSLCLTDSPLGSP